MSFGLRFRVVVKVAPFFGLRSGQKADDIPVCVTCWLNIQRAQLLCGQRLTISGVVVNPRSWYRDRRTIRSSLTIAFRDARASAVNPDNL